MGGLRGERDNGLKWDASVSAARSNIEFFIFSTINASLGPATPTSFRPRDYIQTEVRQFVQIDRLVFEGPPQPLDNRPRPSMEIVISARLPIFCNQRVYVSSNEA